MRCLTALAFSVAASACATASHSGSAVDDIAAARAVFQRNIEAIQAKDRDAYLACYRQDKRLIRAGGSGVNLGFEELAAGTSSVASEWPSKLEAHDLTLHSVRPGVVYGNYRYVVTIAGKTTTGWSERVFVADPGGWRIAVTTAFESAPKPTP